MRSENLGNGYKAFTDEGCTFGTDAVLLSEFAPVKKTDRVCDLGTGCGIIPLMWFVNGTAPCHVDAVDCSDVAVRLAQMAVEHNQLSDRLTVHHQDWHSLTLAPSSYDIVTCNPPYFAGGSGIVPDNAARRLARHEQPDTLPSLFLVAARLLKNDGHFCFCHRPERLADVLAVMREHRFAPSRIRWVYARPDTPPFLWLCDAVHGRTPMLRVLPPLILEK